MSCYAMTPALDYRFAGFWWRFLAYLIDQFLFMIGEGLVWSVVGTVLAGAGWHGDGVALFSGILGFVLHWLYYALFESSEWRATPGKKLCGLIVTSGSGERISFGRATGRYFARILSGLILMIGYMMAGWTQRKQALHDIICDTLVLKRNDPRLRMDVPQVA